MKSMQSSENTIILLPSYTDVINSESSETITLIFSVLVKKKSSVSQGSY